MPISLLYYQSVSNLKYDVNNGVAPINIVNLFRKFFSIHTHSTRSVASDNFYHEISRLKIQEKGFSRTGVKLWNEIPVFLREMTKPSFKKSIKNTYKYF
jgi:23S rRNA C2498 (ribose-2'-O)-methylase RlmM